MARSPLCLPYTIDKVAQMATSIRINKPCGNFDVAFSAVKLYQLLVIIIEVPIWVLSFHPLHAKSIQSIDPGPAINVPYRSFFLMLRKRVR